MNKVVIEITSAGWTETLIVGEIEIIKRWEKTMYGFGGLDTSWDETVIPMIDADLLVEALDSQSFDEISAALSEIEEGES